MSVISIIYPDILELIGQMERFHPRIALRWHMGRVFLLYFGNLAILMWALFERINTESDEYIADPCDVKLTTGIIEKGYRKVTHIFNREIFFKNFSQKFWSYQRAVQKVS